MKRIIDFFRGDRKKQLKRLHTGVLVLAAVYAVQSVLILIFGGGDTRVVTSGYLARDPLLSSDGSLTLSTAWANLLEVRIIYLVAAMMLVAAAFHVLVATVWRKRYESDIDKGINTLRWLMYALVFNFIVVIISLTSGVSDLVSLLLLVLVVLFMSLFGAATDAWSKVGKVPSWVGVASMLAVTAVPWLVVAINVWITSVSGGHIPGSMYLTQLSLFTITALIAANTYLQYKKQGRWNEFLFGERVFLFLLLLAQTVLAWQVVAAT